MNNLSLTLHGELRLSERTKLSLCQLSEILNSDDKIFIRHEKGSNRNHYLFHSSIDNNDFVAIIDSQYNILITLLTIPFYERCACRIPNNVFLQLERLKNESFNFIEEDGVKVESQKQSEPDVIRITDGVCSGHQRITYNSNIWDYILNTANTIYDLPDCIKSIIAPDAFFCMISAGKIKVILKPNGKIVSRKNTIISNTSNNIK